MKNILLLLAVFTAIQSSTAQSVNTCSFVVNGKQVTGGPLSREDILAFDKAQLKDSRLDKTFAPATFQWVISSKGAIFKGTFPSGERFTRTVNNMKSGDVLFIEEVKLKGYTGICQGQWAFTLE